jgi:hypothetical protein
MNIRRLSFGLILSLSSAFVVACGEPAPVETPPQPTAEPAPPPPPTATAEATPPAPTASATAEAPPPPPEKKASEKIVGKWAGALDKDAMAALEKKLEKDKAKDKKIAAEVDKAKETTLEVTADSLTLSKKGKAVSTFKFKVAKNEPTVLTINGDGKDGKKDAPKEVTFTFADDNTVTVKDWAAKDAAKAATWTFKK